MSVLIVALLIAESTTGVRGAATPAEEQRCAAFAPRSGDPLETQKAAKLLELRCYKDIYQWSFDIQDTGLVMRKPLEPLAPLEKLGASRADQKPDPCDDRSEVSPRVAGCSPDKEWDWREHHGLTVAVVRDQGEICGSCWAIAALGAVESNLLIQYDVNVALSTQSLVSCVDKTDCETGGLPVDAFGYMKTSGAALESDYPYEQSRTGERKACRQDIKRGYRVSACNIVGETLVPSPDQIKDSICRHGPVAAAMVATEAFNTYGKGMQLFDQHVKRKTRLNHAILIFGWTKTGWLVRNSQGATWGDNGIGLIAFDSNRIGELSTWVTSVAPPALTPVAQETVKAPVDGAKGDQTDKPATQDKLGGPKHPDTKKE